MAIVCHFSLIILFNHLSLTHFFFTPPFSIFSAIWGISKMDHSSPSVKAVLKVREERGRGKKKKKRTMNILCIIDIYISITSFLVSWLLFFSPSIQIIFYKLLRFRSLLLYRSIYLLFLFCFSMFDYFYFYFYFLCFS